ncbi:MAG: hypothetical protein PHI85_07815 [Victivallaceae bacterium]|nr:hypothetical protein [Victivallaceae bacterium]
MTVYSGTKLINSTMALSSGDIASSTVINSGGVQQIWSGAFSRETVINSGGTQHVLPGGLADLTSISSSGGGYGTQIIYSGGEAYNTLMTGGAQLLFAGAMASGTVLSGLAQQTVYAGATAHGTTAVAGGIQAIYITPGISGVTIGAVDAVIGSGAAQIFMAESQSDYSSVAVLGTRVLSGGTQYLGYFDYSRGGWAYTGGISLSAFLIGGFQHVPYRGVALDTYVTSGGEQYVYYGGMTSGTGIDYGAQLIYEGGAAYDTVLSPASGVSGAYAWQFVLSGGYAFGGYVEGGGQVVSSGGSATGVNVAGSGVQTVHSGGYASGTTVYGGGSAAVLSGAVLDGGAASNGGRIVLESGSVLSGTLTAAGGKVTLSGGAQIAGTLLLTGGTIEAAGAVSYAKTLVINPTTPSSGLPMIVNLDNLTGAALSVSGDGALTGKYVLASGAASPPLGLNLTVGGVETLLTPGVGHSVGEVTYTYTVDGRNLRLDIYGKFIRLSGRATGVDSVLYAENCRVKSMLTGAAENVEGSVYAVVKLSDLNPCNIYGGGNGVSVGGAVWLTLGSGGYSGIIYGGSRSGDNASAVKVGGAVNVTVGAVTHDDNLKMLLTGQHSAWLVGGGVALNGGAAEVVGNVNISIVGATRLARVVAGAQAQNAGSRATVAATTLYIAKSVIVSDVYGGGYAYDGGESTVTGSTALKIDTTEGSVSVHGNIYAGGANPSHSTRGGSSTVGGGTLTVFSGSGDRLNVGVVSGDGRVAGTVSGHRVLDFEDFTGEFSGTAINFDDLVFGGKTEAVLNCPLSLGSLCFDLTKRENLDASAFARLDDLSFYDTAVVKLIVDIEDFNSAGDRMLLDIDNTGVFDGATVELWSYDGGKLAGFGIDEAVAFAAGELRLTRSSGSLAVSYSV